MMRISSGEFRRRKFYRSPKNQAKSDALGCKISVIAARTAILAALLEVHADPA